MTPKREAARRAPLDCDKARLALAMLRDAREMLLEAGLTQSAAGATRLRVWVRYVTGGDGRKSPKYKPS